MMKIHKIILPILALLMLGCEHGPRATQNDFRVISGLSENGNLFLDGEKGSTADFNIKAAYDWSIVDIAGFSCDPSSGSASDYIRITATALRDNNGKDTVRLSPLNFKLLTTRFVGMSAYQYPKIRLSKGDKLYINAKSGATSSIKFISKSEDIEISTEGDIEAVLGEPNSKKEYTITVTALADNLTTEEQTIGTIKFTVGGVKQQADISVIQSSAIIMDRSSVMLPGWAGGENMLHIDSKFDINATTTSDLFTITKGSNNTFAIKANKANSDATERKLGTIELTLADADDCSTVIDVYQRVAVASQTIVVHFVGTGLQSFYLKNVEKMLEALDSDIQGTAQVVIITTDSTNDATLYDLRYDATTGKAVQEKVKELPLPTPYNAELFETNLREAITFAPAEKYALVIGSHGLGWLPKGDSSSSTRMLMNMGYTPSSWWVREEGTLMTRHIGDKSVTQYNISELTSAIAAVNIKFEYILFDACFMGNVESVYELRNSTKYIIGSPCEILGAGFPYDKVMPYMLQNNGTEYNLDKVCYEYVENYRGTITPSACVALTNTAELDALAEAMKAVNTSFIQTLTNRISASTTRLEAIAATIKQQITDVESSLDSSVAYKLRNLHTSLSNHIENEKEILDIEGADEIELTYSTITQHEIISNMLRQIKTAMEDNAGEVCAATITAISKELSILQNECESLNYVSEVQFYDGQTPHSFYDLGDLVRLSGAEQSATSKFKEQLDKTVTSRYNTPQFYSAYGSSTSHYHDITYYTGISTSSMVEQYSYDWRQTLWYKATH